MAGFGNPYACFLDAFEAWRLRGASIRTSQAYKSPKQVWYPEDGSWHVVCDKGIIDAIVEVAEQDITTCTVTRTLDGQSSWQLVHRATKVVHVVFLVEGKFFDEVMFVNQDAAQSYAVVFQQEA